MHDFGGEIFFNIYGDHQEVERHEEHDENLGFAMGRLYQIAAVSAAISSTGLFVIGCFSAAYSLAAS